MTSNFQVTNSTLSADKLAEVIQEKYNLSTFIECKLFRTGMNHVYFVTDGSNKYVFRVYTFNWRTKIEIAEELKLLNYLNENTTSVSYPIADNLNEYIQEFNAPEGKRYGVLFSFADGWKSAKFDAETSYSIGNALAKVHQLTENYSLNRTTYTTEILLVDSLKIIKKFFAKDTEEIKFLEKMSDYLELQFNNFDKNTIRFGAVHLDVWFDNLHFNKENKVTFFDFDFSGNGFLTLDLSYFLFQLFNTNLNEDDYKAKAKNFIQGYESVSKISDEEKRILPIICLAIMTFYISMQCKSFDNWTNIFLNEDHLKRVVGSLKRWITYNEIPIK